MIKIFLTGDNHIGLRYVSHEKAEHLATARIDAFEGMVNAANAEECDFFAVAGDLFERTAGVDMRDISRVTGLLSGFRGTVLIIPGNHDYYDENAVPEVWRMFRQAAMDCSNILLMTELRPYELDAGGKRVVIYPAGCRSPHSMPGENNLRWIKDEDIRPDGAYRIGIAHGAVEGESLDREGNYFSMTREELNAIPVDVWLIGHTHVPFSGGRIFNAGTHVQTDVSCGTEGECLIIEIDEGNGLKPVRAKKFVSGTLRFFRIDVAVNGNLRGALDNQLSGIPDNSAVDVILSGAAELDEYERRDEIIGTALSRFIEGTYDDYGLSRQITEDIITAEFPETSFSARFLTALLGDPKEAQMAYDLLKEASK